LIQLAKTLQSCLRPQDLLGRYGGEEFCVLLPETNAEGARNIAERLRAAAEALEIVFGERKLRATVSIGVAELSAGAIDLTDQLFVEADRELYIAKAEGRNRVSG
jgi:diguanylate cyclase (GGDEF)-like protein